MAKIKPVRVVKTQYGTYSLHFTTPNGRRRRLSVGSNEQHAQRLALKFSDWLIEGKDPEREMDRAKQEEQAKSISLKQFYPIFMERHGSSQSLNMQALYRYRFAQIERCPELADCPLADINKGLVIDYRQARIKLDKVSPATVNRETSVIRSMLSKAVEWDIIGLNPLIGIKLLKEADKRNVSLTHEQAGALLDALPPTVDHIVEFAIYTGLRKQNILGLKVEDVVFHDITSTSEASLILKGGRRTKKVFGKAATEVLRRAIGCRDQGYVFLSLNGSCYKDIKDSFNRAVKKLSLTAEDGSKLRFHDLRHIFASWLGNAGVSMDDLRELLDHRQRDTTDRYVTRDQKLVGQKLDLIPRIQRKGA